MQVVLLMSILYLIFYILDFTSMETSILAGIIVTFYSLQDFAKFYQKKRVQKLVKR